uniref:Nudix hydrolase domain-containing protein n=1 Tax=Panagrolaimus sp. JU765 TaxID=591449 RepID=A0AC34QQC6_9BILA
MTPWKIAATTILRNSALETLMLHRGPTAKFMPNSFVFPGGIVDLEGDSAFPEHKTNYDDSFSKINLGVFATDLPLRVAAARELFEEAGLLLTYDAHTRESKSITAADDKSLTEWRDKVGVF